MKVFREPVLKRAVRRLALRAIAWVEETNNWNPRENGELLVLREALTYCRDLSAAGAVTVIDAGANRGDYVELVCSEASAVSVPVSVHAFEPAASSHALLWARHGGKPNVRINQVALSDRDGEELIFSDTEGSPLASMFQRDLRAIDIELDRSERVRVARLDTYVRETALAHIHLLKVDVEGSEFGVLKGAGDFLNPGFIDFIQFEYGGTNLDAGVPLKSFFSLLEPKGFMLGKLMSGGLRVAKYGSWMDNYLYANYVAISPKAFKRLAHRD
jgi:FkbM family methyltransferase